MLGLGIGVFVLAQFAPDRAYPWITLASGVVVLGLGAGLFVARLRNRNTPGPHGHDHVHHHPHVVLMPQRELVPAIAGSAALAPAPVIPLRPVAHPTNGHVHPAPDLEKPLTRKRLVGLAAAGGILPSPTAIVVLVSTFTAHRIAFGLSLIVAFSVGLAAALVVVGIVALRARTFVAKKLGGPALWILPMLSALVIVGFGVFFVTRGVSGL